MATASYMSRVYICHPYSGDAEGNARKVAAICRQVVNSGRLPIAPQIYLPAFVDEKNERDLAISLCLEMISFCDELLICGDTITEGMRIEIEHANVINIPIGYWGRI